MTTSAPTFEPVSGIPDFWSRCQAAPHRLLGLDYDGTLAPFQVDPMRAYPLEGIRDSLQSLAASESTEVALISGRPVAEVETLLGEFPLVMVGAHGFEHRAADGTVTAREPSPEQQAGLQRARDEAATSGLDPRLETKVASVAVHTRGLSSQRAKLIEDHFREAWSKLAPLHNLECRDFNGGVEIRCLGRNKGDVVEELIAAQPSDTFAVYLGDDDTDEDAFRFLAAHGGIGIKVGRSNNAPTAATGFLEDCRAVERFLRSWLTAAANDEDNHP